MHIHMENLKKRYCTVNRTPHLQLLKAISNFSQTILNCKICRLQFRFNLTRCSLFANIQNYDRWLQDNKFLLVLISAIFGFNFFFSFTRTSNLPFYNTPFGELRERIFVQNTLITFFFLY